MGNANQPASLKGEQLLTIHRALDVLEYLEKVDRAVRLMEISEAVGLPKSQIHRILSTLESRNYVRQNPVSRLYSLGFATWLLSRSMDFARTLVEIAKPVLDDLRDQVQETTFLSVLYGKSVLYLYSAMSPNPTHVYFQIGSQEPIHACASGKAILAHQPSEYVDEVFQEENLARFTQATITDKTRLREELNEIRKQGYAVEREESYYGMSAIATILPIGREGEVAGVGLFLPTIRLEEHTQDSLAASVLAARDEILRKLEGDR